MKSVRITLRSPMSPRSESELALAIAEAEKRARVSLFRNPMNAALAVRRLLAAKPDGLPWEVTKGATFSIPSREQNTNEVASAYRSHGLPQVTWLCGHFDGNGGAIVTRVFRGDTNDASVTFWERGEDGKERIRKDGFVRFALRQWVGHCR